MHTTVIHEISPITMAELPFLIACLCILSIAAVRSRESPLIWLLVGIFLIGTRMVIGTSLVYIAPDALMTWYIMTVWNVLGITGWISITWYCWKALQHTRNEKS
jgi:hypothetical protein